MTFALWKFYAEISILIQREDGQDLVEYALAVALIALGATVGMQSLATGINTAFGSIANSLTSLTA